MASNFPTNHSTMDAYAYVRQSSRRAIESGMTASVVVETIVIETIDIVGRDRYVLLTVVRYKQTLQAGIAIDRQMYRTAFSVVYTYV